MVRALLVLLLIAGFILGGLLMLKRSARTGIPQKLPKPLPRDEEDD